MFWVWPFMPSRELNTPTRRTRARHAMQPSEMDANLAARQALLHVTTILSRTFEQSRRVFARAHALMVHERWMHATFGWALSPTQRLLPSAAWPMAYAQERRAVACGSGSLSYLLPGHFFTLGAEWWRAAAGLAGHRSITYAGWPLISVSPAEPTGLAGRRPPRDAEALPAPFFDLALGFATLFSMTAGLL